MESSVLNLAHEKQRRAEAFLKRGQFNEAVECHEAITNLLVEAQLQLQANANAKFCSISQNLFNLNRDVPRLVTLQSIALQKDYHRRQAQIVRMKQAKYEEYKAKVEAQKNEILHKQTSKTSENYEPDFLSDKEESLHEAIFRTMDKQDNLLSLMTQQGEDEKSAKSKSSGGIIDELRTTNSQLRSFVGNLLNQLELKEQEIKRLRDQLHNSSDNPSEGTQLDSINSVHLEPLPPLAPIEMPEFHLNST